MSRSLAIDLDGALGDTHALWDAFLADAARRFEPIARLDVESLPSDRASAAEELDRWSRQGIGDWRAALTRFAENHAAVYLRPSAGANAALRRLSAAGYRLGVFTDGPEELARVALAQLGAARRVDLLEAGEGARDVLVERLGPDTAVADSQDALAALAAAL